MDFGKLPTEELNNADLSLPSEPAWNKKVLKGKKTANPKVYVGCAKWGRTEWLGKIYPEGTKEARFLDHYVQHYNSIELNATHYRIFPPSTVENWAKKAGDKDFMFCPKVAQTISHYSSFENIDDKTNSFLESMAAFGKHLGPIFLQVSDKYSPKRKDTLISYLKSLPTDLQFFLEVRNKEWFATHEDVESLANTLYDANVGLVITDAAGRRDCVHMHLSIPKAFIRFVGNSLHPTDYTRVNDWVKRIKQWLDKGLQELYFFMHMPDEAYSPELSKYVVDMLNKECGLSLQPPQFLHKTNLLL